MRKDVRKLTVEQIDEIVKWRLAEGWTQGKWGANAEKTVTIPGEGNPMLTWCAEWVEYKPGFVVPHWITDNIPSWLTDEVRPADSEHSPFCSKQSGSVADCPVCNGLERRTAAEQLKTRFLRKKADMHQCRAEAEQILEELRNSCPHHGVLYYTDYKPEGIITGPEGPRMMCSICGLEEDLWSNQFTHPRVLPNKDDHEAKFRVVTLTRDQFFNQRVRV